MVAVTVILEPKKIKSVTIPLFPHLFAHACMKCSLISSTFLKRSPVFPILLFFSASLHYSLKGFLSFLAILWNPTFSWVYLFLSPLLFTSLLSSAIFKATSENYFAFLHFFFLGMILVTASCTVLMKITRAP